MFGTTIFIYTRGGEGVMKGKRYESAMTIGAFARSRLVEEGVLYVCVCVFDL